MVIFWFRRDLRLEDNTALFHALNSGKKVLPIFIFDKNILSELEPDDARVTFIYSSLEKIQDALGEIGRSVAVLHGEPLEVFKKLINDNAVTEVYTNHDYEPYTKERDEGVAKLLGEEHIALKTYKDQVIFEKSEIVKDDGSPYVVYTPFMKKWKQKFSNTLTEPYPSEKHLANLAVHNYPFLSLSDIGFKKSSIKVTPYNISDKLVGEYNYTRDFPGFNGTSFIGAW